jgi:hypothetical protein
MPVYILFGRVAVPVPDLMTWLNWLRANAAHTRVGLDRIGRFIVSTQFIGLVAPGTSQRPALYSATVARADGSPVAVAYASSWDEAERTHRDLCAAAEHANRRSLTNS